MSITYENHYRAGNQLCRDIGLPFNTDRAKLAMLLRAERRALIDKEGGLSGPWLKMIEDIFEEQVK